MIRFFLLTSAACAMTTAIVPGADDRTRDETRDDRSAAVALGRLLFFDPILSTDGTVSCATCHIPERAFAGTDPVAVGVQNRTGRRNAPTLLNRSDGQLQFWDGRASSLEEQALMPIESETEFGSSIADVLTRLRGNKTYTVLFEQSFRDGITADNLARSIAEYERTLIADDSPVDRFMQAEFTALTDSARRGKWIFESSGRCWRCHSGANFTDEKFHNTGVSWGASPPDLGRFEVTAIETDRGAFKTPSLRNVALTAPYMHDGSMDTLRDVVEFYRDGGIANPHRDPLMQPVELSERDIHDLVAFLDALTSNELPDVAQESPER